MHLVQRAVSLSTHMGRQDKMVSVSLSAWHVDGNVPYARDVSHVQKDLLDDCLALVMF